MEEVSRSFGDFHFSELFELGPTFINVDTDGSTHESSTSLTEKKQIQSVGCPKITQASTVTQHAKASIIRLANFQKDYMLLFATHLKNVEERKLRARGASTRSCGDQRTAVPAIPKLAIRQF